MNEADAGSVFADDVFGGLGAALDSGEARSGFGKLTAEIIGLLAALGGELLFQVLGLLAQLLFCWTRS